jgi:hypothetical protein
VERCKGEVQCLSDDGGNLYINCTCLPLRFFFIKLNKKKNRFCYFGAENMVKAILNIEKSVIYLHGG